MSIRKTKNADIQYGKKDKLKESDFEPKNVGHRISIVVPVDVLMAFREQAGEEGIGYQTLMNRVLRSHLSGGKTLLERLTKLEKAVFQQGRK